MRTSVPVLLASAALLLGGRSHDQSAATANDPVSEPASNPPAGSSTKAATSSTSGVIAEGTYSTGPLSAAFLRHAGFTRAQVLGNKTVFTLKLDNGDYAIFDAEDGKAPEEGDSGTYELRGHTMSFVSSGDGARSDYTYRRTADGFRLHVKRFFSGNATDHRIATVVWTSAPYHLS